MSSRARGRAQSQRTQAGVESTVTRPASDLAARRSALLLTGSPAGGSSVVRLDDDNERRPMTVMMRGPPSRRPAHTVADNSPAPSCGSVRIPGFPRGGRSSEGLPPESVGCSGGRVGGSPTVGRGSWLRDEGWSVEPELRLAGQVLTALVPGAALPLAAAEYAAAWDARLTRRASEVVNGALEVSGLSPEDLLGRVRQDEQLSVLFAMTVDAAQRSYTGEKVRALAMALGAALDDSAMIDEEQLIVAALSQLEAVHVRALRTLVDVEEQEGEPPESVIQALGSMQVGEDAAHALVGVLVSCGAVRVGTPGQVAWGNIGQTVWEVTPFGERLLGYLSAAFEDADKF
jgi:hypothetical protein